MYNPMASYMSVGAQADVEAVRRRGMGDIFDLRFEQRKRNVAAISQLMGLGQSLWDRYKSNKEIIEFGQKHGLDVVSNKFEQWFGQPRFTREEDELKYEHVFAAKMLQDYKSTKNLMDAIFGEGE